MILQSKMDLEWTDSSWEYEDDEEGVHSNTLTGEHRMRIWGRRGRSSQSGSGRFPEIQFSISRDGASYRSPALPATLLSSSVVFIHCFPFIVGHGSKDLEHIDA